MDPARSRQIATVAGPVAIGLALGLGIVGMVARSGHAPPPVTAIDAGVPDAAAAIPPGMIPSDKAALETHRYETRKRPERTFDVLSELVLPGCSTTQIANIPGTWQILGPPSLAIDPNTNERSPFKIESATRTGDRYVITAKNAGAKPARLVADVPYVAWSK